MKEPEAGPEGGEKGVAGEKGPTGRNIWRTESSTRLQTANLGKGQWFAAGFMGKLLKRENTYPVRFAKDFCEKSSCGGFFRLWMPSRSGVFENQDAAILERDFWGLHAGR